MKKLMKKRWLNNNGVSVIEVILILLVVIGLVIIFRTQITAIANSIFTKINRDIQTF